MIAIDLYRVSPVALSCLFLLLYDRIEDIDYKVRRVGKSKLIIAMIAGHIGIRSPSG